MMNQRKLGVILSYIKMILSGLVNLVYIPLLLFFLSKEQYGLYQLVGSIVAYLMLMDFGLSDTVTRYYANYMARNDKEKLQRLISTVGALYSLISILVVGAGILLLYLFLPVYAQTLTVEQIHTAKIVYIILLVNVALVIPSNVFKAVINAHQRFIFAETLIIVNTIVQPIVICAVLMAWPTVVALALVQTICNLLMIVCNIYYCVNSLHISFKWLGTDQKILKETLLFSSLWFTVALVDQIFWRSGQLVLGAVVGTAAVAVYSVTIQLQMLYGWFSAIISKVFLPQLSAIVATTNDWGEINSIFLKTSRLQMLISSLLVSGFILLGKSFIYLWLGEGFSSAYNYGVILMLCFFIPSVQHTALSILQAKNKLSFYAGVYVFLAVVSLLVSVILAKYYGGSGCAWATGGALLLGGLVMNVYYAKMGICMRFFWKDILQIAGLSILTGGAFYMLKQAFFPSADVLSFSVVGLVYTLVWSTVMWLFVLNNYEKGLVSEFANEAMKWIRLKRRES